MNDDWALFMAVSFLMAVMLTLCIYLQNWALAKQDWVNLKCNPLYMFIHSIGVDNKTSISNFQSCVKQM